MKDTAEIGTVLNKLLQNNLDSEKGFRNAADDVENEQLKSLFTDLAQQKYDFSHQLRGEVRTLGEPPARGSSFSSDMHRTLMNIRSGLSPNSEKVVLAEVAQGEQKILEEYEDIITRYNFPSSIDSILKRQMQALKASLEKINTLHDQFS